MGWRHTHIGTLHFSLKLTAHIYLHTYIHRGFPGGLGGKEPTCNTGDVDLNPGSRTSVEGGNGNLLQYFCLKNPMDRGAWRAPWGCKIRHNSATEHTYTYIAVHTVFSIVLKHIRKRDTKCCEVLMLLASPLRGHALVPALGALEPSLNTRGNNNPHLGAAERALLLNPH